MKTALIVILLCGTCSFAQTENQPFRWIDRTANLAIYRQVEKAFATELKPDQYDAKSSTVPMTVKFLQKVGVVGDTALVIVAEKEGKTDPYTVSRAYRFNLKSGEKAALREKGVEWFWQWAPVKVAHVRSPEDTTVVFRFLTCTECESERVLSAFHYSRQANTWEIQQWGKDGPGLLIGSDVQYGDDGFYHYDCLHVVEDLTGDGLDDVAVRCREQLQPDPEKDRMKTTRDEVLLYTAKNGKVVRQLVPKGSELGATVNAALCSTKENSPLCRQSKSDR